MTKQLLFLGVAFISQFFLSNKTYGADGATQLEALKIDFQVEKYQLSNGLTVLLHENHTVPIVSYHTWYRVGSRDEGPGVTGAAHMLEHMMFRGAEKYTGTQFDKMLQANGVSHNAFTTNDYTGFYENLPSSKLEVIMDLEVDRMRSLKIDPEALRSELQVVGEERRWRIENNPDGLLYELLMGSIFNIHPYTWPVIGHMTDIQAYTSEKLRKFYDSFYGPNNAVLVIAGDFKPEVVKPMIEKYYGPLARREVPPRNYPQEPDRTSGFSKSIDWDVQATSFVLGVKGMKAGSKEGFAMDLAASILGDGASSRLHKKLVYKKQLAIETSAANWTPADPGIFMVSVSMRPGKNNQDIKQAEEIAVSELMSLRDRDVSEKELQKAKNQVMKSTVDSLSTIDARARSLAVNEIVLGDYRRLFTDLEEYSAVTVRDIRNAAKQYIRNDRLVKVYLNPKETKKDNQKDTKKRAQL